MVCSTEAGGAGIWSNKSGGSARHCWICATCLGGANGWSGPMLHLLAPPPPHPLGWVVVVAQQQGWVFPSR